MPNPSVSVIVPTYNRPGFLARALVSIKAQTFNDYEVIVINDGGESVSELVSLFTRTRLITHINGMGLPAARNSGIESARGKYIAYLDDDDMWLPQHLEKLVTYRSATSCQLVYSDTYFWIDERKFELLLSEEHSKQALLGQNMTPCCSVLHDRVLFEMAGNFDESLEAHEDYDMWLRMSQYTDFAHLAQVTALYSKRTGSDQMSMDLPHMHTTREAIQARHRERISA